MNGTDGNVDENGCFYFEVEEGEYEFAIGPAIDFDSPDRRYIPISTKSFWVDESNPLDLQTIELTRGGNITGTITFPPGSENYPQIFDIAVLNASGVVIGGGSIDTASSSGNQVSYSTYALPPASGAGYTLLIIDTFDLFYAVYYDDIPKWMGHEAAAYVPVTVGADTEGVDFTLRVRSKKHYFIRDLMPNTAHISSSGEPLTHSSAWLELGQFSGPTLVRPDEISSISLEGPAGTFSDSTSSVELFWRFVHNHPVVGDYKWTVTVSDGPEAMTHAGEDVALDDGVPHPPGDYSVTVTMENGDVLTESVTVEGGLSWNELPPVTNLSATYNVTNGTMQVGWKLPDTTYPEDTTLEILVSLFNGGHSLNNQIYIKKLDVYSSAYTFSSMMTSVFASGRADQLMIEVRVAGPNETDSMTRQAYSFDPDSGLRAVTGISAVYDVNGDGQTGLEEVIHALKSITE